MIRRATLFVAIALLAAACGGGTGGPQAGVTPSPRLASTDSGSGTLPDSGAMVRVVNLFADESGPQAIDVFGFNGTEIQSQQVRVASVAYGQVSDWFDPGYVKGSDDSHLVSVAMQLKDKTDRLGGISDVSIVSGSRATVIIGPSDGFGARMRVALDSHPDTSGGNVPQAPSGAALLVTSYEGLPPADFQRAVFFASVGNYCLPGKFRDTDIEEVVGHPLGQPIGNELVVEPGAHTLTVHRASAEPGAIETCKNNPVADAPLQLAAGGRAYAFLYAEVGVSKVNLLVVPFEG